MIFIVLDPTCQEFYSLRIFVVKRIYSKTDIPCQTDHFDPIIFEFN